LDSWTVGQLDSFEDILVEEEDAHSAGAASDDGVDDGQGNDIRVSGFGNRSLCPKA